MKEEFGIIDRIIHRGNKIVILFQTHCRRKLLKYDITPNTLKEQKQTVTQRKLLVSQKWTFRLDRIIDQLYYIECKVFIERT